MLKRKIVISGAVAIGILLAGIIFVGCQDDSSTNASSDNNTFLSIAYPSDDTFADVEQLKIRVTGPDIALPLTASHAVDHNQTYAVIELAVPAGNNRRITVHATNHAGDTLYWAAVTLAVASGQRNNVAALLIPINRGVRVYIPYPEDALFDQVNEIQISVTGEGIESPLISTQLVDHEQTSMVVELSVPSGVNRYFDIYGLNTFDRYLYRAQVTISLFDSLDNDIAVNLLQLGYGEARRVRIFRNSLPWGFADLDTLLDGMGFSQGPGDNQYQVFNSTLMGSILLVPGRDIVIFEGWQDTAFYNDYMAAHDYFEEFVDMGGSMLMVADAGSTHSGYFDSTHMQFPAGVVFTNISSNLNRVVTPYHVVVAGMRDSLSGSQISYGSLGALPPGALPLTQNHLGQATLVIYAFGKGSVIMSSQPLEYLYHHSGTYTTCGSLLARIVRFMLGKDPTPNPKIAG